MTNFTPDRSRLVQLPWGRAYVRDIGLAGEDPPIVLVHGVLVTHYAFRHVAPRLATQRRVLAMDLPGCGDSDRPSPARADGYSPTWLAEALLELLGVMGLETVDLVGHSWGGTVSVCVAELAPSRVRRLVLADAACFPLPMALDGRLAALPVLGPWMLKHVFRRGDLRRYLRRATSAPELVEEEAVDVYWDRLHRDGGPEAAHAMTKQLTALEHVRDRLERIQAPTLVCWGDRDRIIPIEHGERMAELMPDARWEVIDGCGHAPAEERPEVFADLVLDHCGVGDRR